MREQRSVEQYLAEVLALVSPDSRVQQLPLSLAGGRLLAEPVVSAVSIPVFDNSAMDGYAVRFAEVAAAPARLRVVGDVPAGSAVDPAAGGGECVRIMTGAALPSFADTVVPIEEAVEADGLVTLTAPPAHLGRHVRRAGEDISLGTVLAQAGTTLTPALLGAFAGGGIATVPVRPRPLVALAVTGDELVAPGQRLARGQIYESNSVVLSGLLAAHGAEVRHADRVPDRAEDLIAWLDRVTFHRHPGLDPGSPPADLIVLTGGASVGAYDVVRDVLTQQAEGRFRHVRMQPGKPQGWAVWRGTPVLALPGNPVSAALSCELFVAALLDRILGRSPAVESTAVAGMSWSSPAGRRQYVPVTFDTDPSGRLVATPTHARGSASHLVTSWAGADGLAIVPEATTAVTAGDAIAVRRLP